MRQSVGIPGLPQGGPARALLKNHSRVNIGKYVALHLGLIQGGYNGSVCYADHQSRIFHHDQGFLASFLSYAVDSPLQVGKIIGGKGDVTSFEPVLCMLSEFYPL